MKLIIQLIIENDEGQQEALIEEIASLERHQLTPQTLGLSLAEAKELLAEVQKKLVSSQVAAYLKSKQYCSVCGKGLKGKEHRHIVFRSLFGKLELDSPRYYSCPCQPQTQKSVSSLLELLPERTALEFLYLQTKWAALMSYGLTSSFLIEVLPLEKPISTAVLSERVQEVAERMEKELGTEQVMFIEGCQLDWEALPQPDAPLTIGIDEGYVRGGEGQNRKSGNFEIIMGKSMPQAGPNKRFGFVSGYGSKPKRRLFELLKSQGMQFNQQVTFLSDGGDTVRDLQLYLNP